MGGLFSVFGGSFANGAPHCSHHNNMIESLITAATELAMEEAKSTRHKRERRKRRQKEREMEQQQQLYPEEPEFQPQRQNPYASTPIIPNPWHQQPYGRSRGEGRQRQHPLERERPPYEPWGGSFQEDGSTDGWRGNGRNHRDGMPRQNRARNS